MRVATVCREGHPRPLAGRVRLPEGRSREPRGERRGFGARRAPPPVPHRFQDIATWRHAPKSEHPCYTTTSSDYGKKLARQVELPLVYAGLNGKFTSGIPFMPTPSGLNTAVPRSRVHDALLG